MLLEEVESRLPVQREREFPPTQTLSMFLSQALSADRSCQNVVNEAALSRVSAGMAPCSTNTGAYCQARQRLPRQLVSGLTRAVGRTMSADAVPDWCWRGRPVRLVDGSTIAMADTPANQEPFPQSRSQQPGLGHPLCRLGVLICLGTGALLDAAVGRYQGKGGDEQTLLRSMLAG